MLGMTGGEDDGAGLTSWDRRVIRAVATADTARKAALLLRWVAGVIAVTGVVGYALLTVRDYGFEDSALGSIETPDRYQVGTFLVGAMWSLGLAGVIVGVSFLVEIYASRLDLDIVDADESQSSSVAPGWRPPDLGG